MQFARSPEEDEDKEATSHPGYSSETFQVYGAAWPAQEAVIPCCLSSGTQTS